MASRARHTTITLRTSTEARVKKHPFESVVPADQKVARQGEVIATNARSPESRIGYAHGNANGTKEKFHVPYHLRVVRQFMTTSHTDGKRR